MDEFSTDVAVYISQVCEALFMMLDEVNWDNWIGGISLDSDLVLELSELLYDRGIDGTDLYEYFMQYEFLENIWEWDAYEDDWG
jgi:hypothetical protein